MKTQSQIKAEKRQKFINSKYDNAYNVELLKVGSEIKGKRVLSICLNKTNAIIKLYKDGYVYNKTVKSEIINNEPCEFVTI